MASVGNNVIYKLARQEAPRQPGAIAVTIGKPRWFYTCITPSQATGPLFRAQAFEGVEICIELYLLIVTIHTSKYNN